MVKCSQGFESHLRISCAHTRRLTPLGAAALQAAMPKRVKVLRLHKGTQLTNILGTAEASKPVGHDSFISYWRQQTGVAAPVCFELSCHAAGRSGGHVKLADSAIGATFKRNWYIVPACSTHNKGHSCGTYLCKANTLIVKVGAGALAAQEQCGKPLRDARWREA